MGATRRLKCRYTLSHSHRPCPQPQTDGRRLPRAVRREVVAALEQVTNARDHEILRRRYILGQNFEQISAEMHIDYRWVRRIHKRSLIQLE